MFLVPCPDPHPLALIMLTSSKGVLHAWLFSWFKSSFPQETKENSLRQSAVTQRGAGPRGQVLGGDVLVDVLVGHILGGDVLGGDVPGGDVYGGDVLGDDYNNPTAALCCCNPNLFRKPIF